MADSVPIDLIVDLAETSGIRAIDPQHVERLALAIDSLPAVDVVKLSEGRLGLLAGYHRREAHRQAGRQSMCVVVHDLDREEWHRFAVRSNLDHGKPLSTAERKNAARRMLGDNPHRSDRAIAADCALSDKTVAKLRDPDVASTTADNPQLHVGLDGRARRVRPADEKPRQDAAKSKQAPAVQGEKVPPKTRRNERQLDARVNKTVELLSDPEIRDAIKARVDNSRTARQTAAAVRAFEKAEEQRQVALEKEKAQLAKAEHDQAMKRNEYWFALQKRLDTFHDELAPYILEFDNLPTPHNSVLQGVDRRIDDLVNSLRVLQSHMFPGRVKGKGGLKGGTVIDIFQ